MLRAFLCLFITICGGSAFSAEMTMRARGNDNLNDFFFSQLAVTSSSANYLIRVNVSCFGSTTLNLTNPVAPTGLVRMNIGIGPASNPTTKTGGGDFVLEFPGWMALAKTSTLARTDVIRLMDTSNASPNPLTAAFGTQNTLLARPPASAVTGLTGPSFPRAQTLRVIKYINFEQDIQAIGNCWGVAKNEKPQAPGWVKFLAPRQTQAGGGCCDANNVIGPQLTNPIDTGFNQPTCNSGQAGWDLSASMLSAGQITNLIPIYKQFMGKDGPLNGEWRAVWSSDYKTLMINVAFPGELAHCGSYYSPLMLFFDKKRPQFTARSDFEIHPQAKSTFWPEKKSPGYFLVLDRNKNGIIDNYTELFGDDVGYGNGFEKLRTLDSNQDGVIDENDPEFANLRLWQDSTGKGVTRKKDIHTLKELGVTSISLDYAFDSTEKVADRAMFRERASFTFKSKLGERKGEIVDVWFSN